METPPLRHHDTVRLVRGHHTGQWLLNGCSYTFDLPCRSGFVITHSLPKRGQTAHNDDSQEPMVARWLLACTRYSTASNITSRHDGGEKSVHSDRKCHSATLGDAEGTDSLSVGRGFTSHPPYQVIPWSDPTFIEIGKNCAGPMPDHPAIQALRALGMTATAASAADSASSARPRRADGCSAAARGHGPGTHEPGR